MAQSCHVPSFPRSKTKVWAGPAQEAQLVLGLTVSQHIRAAAGKPASKGVPWSPTPR